MTWKKEFKKSKPTYEEFYLTIGELIESAIELQIAVGQKRYNLRHIDYLKAAFEDVISDYEKMR
tara:strand:- start:196 stop:387 length:192 start_codon:yes stop_codon:yes gene_type:complete